MALWSFPAPPRRPCRRRRWLPRWPRLRRAGCRSSPRDRRNGRRPDEMGRPPHRNTRPPGLIPGALDPGARGIFKQHDPRTPASRSGRRSTGCRRYCRHRDEQSSAEPLPRGGQLDPRKAGPYVARLIKARGTTISGTGAVLAGLCKMTSPRLFAPAPGRPPNRQGRTPRTQKRRLRQKCCTCKQNPAPARATRQVPRHSDPPSGRICSVSGQCACKPSHRVGRLSLDRRVLQLLRASLVVDRFSLTYVPEVHRVPAWCPAPPSRPRCGPSSRATAWMRRQHPDGIVPLFLIGVVNLPTVPQTSGLPICLPQLLGCLGAGSPFAASLSGHRQVFRKRRMLAARLPLYDMLLDFYGAPDEAARAPAAPSCEGLRFRDSPPSMPRRSTKGRTRPVSSAASPIGARRSSTRSKRPEWRCRPSSGRSRGGGRGEVVVLPEHPCAAFQPPRSAPPRRCIRRRMPGGDRNELRALPSSATRTLSRSGLSPASHPRWRDLLANPDRVQRLGNAAASWYLSRPICLGQRPAGANLCHENRGDRKCHRDAA